MRRPTAGFTFVELMIGALVFGAVSLMVVSFVSTSSRLASRNLAANHGHEAVRTSAQRLFRELHASGSSFGLFNFNGTTYADFTPTVTGDRDVASGQYLSARTNGVRFRRLAGGPYKLSQSVAAGAAQLRFDFAGPGNYSPQVGDKVRLPLIDEEYTISGVTGTVSPGNTNVVITLNRAIAYTIAVDATKLTTGYFYRMSAFSVWANELRYHPYFHGTSRGTFTVVRHHVTSPKPFAAVYSSAGATDPTQVPSLSIHLESYDLGRSAGNFQGAASTLVSLIPARNSTLTSSSALRRLDDPL